MGHESDTVIYEYYAKRILEETFPERYQNLRKSERPDLVSESGIGIEVTQACDKTIKEAEGFFHKFMNKTPQEIGGKNLAFSKRIFEEEDVYLFFNGKLAAFSPPAHWVTIEQLKEAYCKKIEKLQTYRACSKNELFIFDSGYNSYELSEVEQFSEWINQATDRNLLTFDAVYVRSNGKLYRCEPSSLKVDEYEVDTDAFGDLKQEAAVFAAQSDI